MHSSNYSDVAFRSGIISMALLAALAGCGGGGGSTKGGGGTAGGTPGAGGSITATGGAGTVGGGSGGSTGAAGSMAIAPAPAGEHFCECDLTEAGAWPFGRQKNCRVSWAKTGTLTTAQKQALDYGCEAPYCKLTTSCPRTAPDAVGLCVGIDSPVLPTRTYAFVEKANITPNATAFAVNATAICGSAAYDLAGNAVTAKCAGTMNAIVDGTVVDFSTNILCWFKSDGAKSQYFVSGQDPTKTKSINLNILQEGTTYSVPGTALAPGFGYLENNTAFAFPKDATTIAVTVSQFAAGGAALQATFSPGELYTQPGGKGTGPRTFTDGAVDVMILP
jgi:hypothetical protein